MGFRNLAYQSQAETIALDILPARCAVEGFAPVVAVVFSDPVSRIRDLDAHIEIESLDVQSHGWFTVFVGVVQQVADRPAQQFAVAPHFANITRLFATFVTAAFFSGERQKINIFIELRC